MMQSADKQNLIYLYDLPKDSVDSKKIAEAFKARAGIALKSRPQIRKDITRPFWTAIVTIPDDAQFKEACEKMKYFEIEGKQCRGLKFDRQLLGTNREKLTQQNIFIRSIPAAVSNQQLHDTFEKFGGIKSLKISFNEDHSSRGYGFVCFEGDDTANQAIAATGAGSECVAVKFQPKDRRNMRRLINNIYVKNIPAAMTDADIKKLFSEYGHIKSLVLSKHEIGQYGFVCYDDPEGTNVEYGPACAQKALEALQGKEMGTDASGTALKLYIRHALKKVEREAEKKKETLRYKASKKRCNLYVKNFPGTWGEAELHNLFKDFGTIEKIKFQEGQRSGNFAFVCFKQPDHAANAKQSLSNAVYEGKTLVINHYEIKELREIQVQDQIDKADFEKYQASQTGSMQLNDLTSHPNITQILQQLLDIMQQNQQMTAAFSNNERHMGGQRNQGGNRRPNYNNRAGGPMRTGGMPNQGPPMPQQAMGGAPMPPAMQGPPMPMAQQPMPGQPGVPQGMPMQGHPNQQMNSVVAQYQQ
jgi:RNA recognition motif-containing protein